MQKEVSAVAKIYEFTLWLLPIVAKFPREHRFTLGNRMEDGVLAILELLAEASYTREKRELLRQANLRLERLRYLIRLAKDLKLLSLKQYEFAVQALFAAGNEIGGWARQQKQAGGSYETA
jgi:hypothetical protein